MSDIPTLRPEGSLPPELSNRNLNIVQNDSTAIAPENLENFDRGEYYYYYVFVDGKRHLFQVDRYRTSEYPDAVTIMPADRFTMDWKPYTEVHTTAMIVPHIDPTKNYETLTFNLRTKDSQGQYHPGLHARPFIKWAFEAFNNIYKGQVKQIMDFIKEDESELFSQYENVLRATGDRIKAVQSLWSAERYREINFSKVSQIIEIVTPLGKRALMCFYRPDDTEGETQIFPQAWGDDIVGHQT